VNIVHFSNRANVLIVFLSKQKRNNPMPSPKILPTSILSLAFVTMVALAPVQVSAQDVGPAFVTHKVSNGKIRAGIAAFDKADYAKAAFFQKSALKSGLSRTRKVAAYTNLCAAEAARGQLEDAKTACDAALAISPNAWDALNNRGVVFWLSGDKNAAATDFAAAKAADGSNSVISHNLQMASAN
jgi:tetratricopeptide (TPR) repeat protein